MSPLFSKVYNNYYKDVKISGIDSRVGAQILIESNNFNNVLKRTLYLNILLLYSDMHLTHLLPHSHHDHREEGIRCPEGQHLH